MNGALGTTEDRVVKRPQSQAIPASRTAGEGCCVTTEAADFGISGWLWQRVAVAAGEVTSAFQCIPATGIC